MTSDEMDALLSQAEQALGGRWSGLMDWLRSQNSIDDIASRLMAGAFEEALTMIEQAAQRWSAVQQQQYVRSASKMADWIENKTGLPVNFDQANTRAIEWAKNNQLDMVSRITSEQRQVMRNVITDGVRRADNPRVIAKDIQESIGLTPAQERYVSSYRTALESGNFSNALSREMADGRFDRTLERLQRDGGMLDQGKADRMISVYRGNMQTLRAETIARTEALRVVHQGADEQINQAIEAGDLPADAVVRTWISTRDHRTRKSHHKMNNQTRAFGEAFRTGDGVNLAFPGDPDGPAEETINCRCVVTTRLVFGKIREFRKARGLMLPVQLIAA